ncbi:MAG: hypothetical protein FJ184_10235 [Gammaproteobacteria bacterium]|nr:hypothetical protein [Gammaproteobacteria bacterium]
MRFLKLSVAAIASLFIGGCATSSKNIAAVYVSPAQYQSYDCKQLLAEADRIRTRVVQLGGRLDEAATNDKMIAGAAVLIFWPALFALGGTKEQEAEYARLKGESDAINQAMIQKKCGA